jgi:hypothetical protein
MAAKVTGISPYFSLPAEVCAPILVALAVVAKKKRLGITSSKKR